MCVCYIISFFLIKPVYNFFQNRFFPYRNSKLDIFLTLSFILFIYLIFLSSPPSLLRAFTMLIVGFFLYDRGVKIVSMQTLFLSVVLLVAFFPRLFFMVGFWLSAAGVFYIFLFLSHFKNATKTSQFILLPIWVYLLMLPFSLALFHNFTIYHPLSIIFTLLFTLFYPLSILLHVLGFGDFFDRALLWLIALGENGSIVKLNIYIFLFYILLSFKAVFSKRSTAFLLLFAIFIFIKSIYHIT